MAAQQFIESLFIVLYLGFTSWLIIGIIAWSIAWKIAALWKAGQSGQKAWFVILALAPTFGILEIFYFIIYNYINNNSIMSKRLKIILSLILLIVVFILLSFMGSSPQPVVDPPLSGAPYELTGTFLPKDDRILSIDVNMAGDNDYDKAFRLAKEAGMQASSLSINWDYIEPEPGKYQDQANFLEITNIYNSAQKTGLALYLRSIDTASRPVPPYLKDTPHDNSKVAERYLKMLDWVLPKLKDVRIEFLSVGDEIDVMMGKDKKLYRQFEVFFKTVKPAIKAKYPNLKVGFSATLYGLTGLTGKVTEDLKRINAHSDIVLVSYYPLNDDSSPKDPKTIAQEFDELVKQYPNRTIYIEQYGCPTSAFLGSSEAKQADCIKQAFQSWDKYANQIKYFSFTWLHDLDKAGVEGLKEYYKFSDKRFLEYLRTLGFRTVDGSGQDKLGFRALRAEAKARGW